MLAPNIIASMTTIADSFEIGITRTAGDLRGTVTVCPRIFVSTPVFGSPGIIGGITGRFLTASPVVYHFHLQDTATS
jgi:hypothetical protein